MTPTDLKYRHESAYPSSHFFSKGNMRAFGDTMRNFGVRSSGDNWELFRKKPVLHGVNGSHFFDKETFKHVYP